MKIDKFKKLEKKIKGYNFHESYKSINIIMITLSWFGHIASIFLAYFFVSKILSGAMTDNPVVVLIASIIILSGLELLKRDIFDKFSIQSLKDKALTKAVLPLMATSILLISGSFYSSINGAKEFSSKSKQIDAVAEQVIDTYSDSITAVYFDKIVIVETQNSDLFEMNKKLDEEARELPTTYVTSKLKIRNQIDKNNTQAEKNDVKISDIKSERDGIIEKYENKTKKDSSSKKDENSKNSFLFIMISTLIELVILSGVYFSEYYSFRSYREEKEKLEKDPTYLKWLLYDQMLSIVITDNTKMNEKLPSIRSIIEDCKINDIIVLNKDVTNFLKITANLNIIRTSGSVKYVTKTKEIAQEILRKHFNIE